MKDVDRLIVRFRQFGGLRLVWEYAKLGVLWVVVKEFFTVIVKRRSMKSIYPAILQRIEPVLLAKYCSNNEIQTINEVPLVQRGQSRIWWCWLQGLELAPPLAKACLRSLQQLDTEVVIIDETNYTDWVELPEHIVNKYKARKIPAALFSDILRLALLIKYGGIWIDSTVLCSLNRQSTKYCPSWEDIVKSDLFVFQYTSPGGVWTGNISNWFISAKQNNPLLIELYDALCSYWKENDCTLDYYIFHLFFAELAKRYPEMISNMPYGYSTACLQLRNNLGEKFSVKKWEKIKSLSNFHKMSPRLRRTTVEGKDNFFQYVISGVRTHNI